MTIYLIMGERGRWETTTEAIKAFTDKQQARNFADDLDENSSIYSNVWIEETELI